ncbi:peptide ABC transporter substrate-binding protein [Sulfitobacter alexandrii]|uniref:Peptide ABC transporter substrate-binding protein n=1 Tax=Sulfitobacter alexandrii TaxID=1917485 RepID=A0A1J0WE79_9RHOB|nr:ABC transporter substrate-binding protein [Sulfitobacter alexandrii]APE42488.1 peptide ABC transporter substrate-binding protein [Sulfitobacter alexandrii]
MKLLKYAAAFALTAQIATAQEPQTGGTLRLIAQPEPPMLMLGLNQQGPTQFVAGKIYEGLLRYGPDLSAMPGLAEAWEVSEDGLTYTFDLQDDVTWHDGEPFTSDDVVFSLSEFLPEVHPRARGVLERVKEISAPDDNTVKITLNESFPAFLQSFEVSSTPMIPAHLYRDTDYRANPANDTPVGTGPFKLDEWQRGSFIRLVRNDDYWQDGKPYLDEIVFNIVPDAASRAVAFETGEVDVLRGGDVEYFDVQRLAALPDTEVTNAGWEFLSPIIWVQFNLRNEPMNDPRFRKAVWHAIDRDFIANAIWMGFADPADGPLPANSPYHADNLPAADYDPEKSRALLDEMGLTPDDNGVRVTVRYLSLPYSETYIRMGEYVRQQLREVGIELDVTQTDVGGWAQTLGQWDYDLTMNLLYQYGDPALGVERAYVSSNLVQGSPSANVSGLDNPEIDRLLSEAASATSDEKRKELYQAFQQKVVEEAYFAYLVRVNFPTVYHTRVRNLVDSAIGLNDTMADVWIAR